MIIVVRIGLGLAYQGASSTPPYRRREYHDPSPSSALSFDNRNKGQLSTFQAASHRDDNNLQSTSLGNLSSRTKLDVGMGSESRVAAGDDDDLYVADRNSGLGERNGEKEGKTV